MEYSDLFSGDESELPEQFVTHSEGLEFAREALRRLGAGHRNWQVQNETEYSARLVADQVEWLEGLARRNAAKADETSDSVR